MNKAVPAVLYKYRRFDARTIELLCADRLYYADPDTFNDPLDCQPCVEADCDVATLERTVYELVRRRVEGEMRMGARTVKYRGPKTISHIEKHSREEAQQTIDRLRYNATDPDLSDDPPGPHAYVLASTIENELLRQYNKGILSLATRHDCPLMWSHYGDQHRGLCIGYSVPEEARTQLHEVLYGGNRNVKASDVAAMLAGDEQARVAVDEAVLLRKAPDWRYENEWRVLGTRGAEDSTLEMVEIVFGMRCGSTVMHTVASALKGREKPVELFEMHEVRGTFELQRSEVNVDELSVYYPRRALSAFEGFEFLDPEGDESSA
ncbi:DUF2971 domain-containing protein [Caballeronia sordidicola]|uniref:DUF2971 domain-containing protein n=1 Tax=Caballeronia sordidicola TaxID=196367 RepID=UPI0004CFFFD4|nr:DUF2971 domain-containing protein [Caballeronia sordidicola]